MTSCKSILAHVHDATSFLSKLISVLQNSSERDANCSILHFTIRDSNLYSYWNQRQFCTFVSFIMI